MGDSEDGRWFIRKPAIGGTKESKRGNRNVMMSKVKDDEQKYDCVKTTSQHMGDQYQPDDVSQAGKQAATCSNLTNKNGENGISRNDMLDN